MNLLFIESRECTTFSRDVDIFSGMGNYFQVSSYEMGSDFQVWGLYLKEKGLT